MKSVIMAGGMGTRLKPLTCMRPKPLVPFMGKAMIDHVISHLEQNGIKEHIVTLFHLPQTIIDHLSEKEWVVDFTVEKEPRGTAGSVKEAANFLRSTFVVASGDAITDIDLKKALIFHRKKGSLATIVLTRALEPLEYGIVLADADGKITRFLEKPTWGEVFSDTVNTGIYILEPEALEYIPKDRIYDFSRDLFPALLKANLPLFGYVADGYWSDVGSITQYRDSHFDALDGKINTIRPFIHETAAIADSAKIIQPVSILRGAKIGERVKLGPYVVIGEDVVIKDESELLYTIVAKKSYLGSGTYVKGSIIDEKAYIGTGSRLLESTVISQDSEIGERSLLTPRVKVYPGKIIGPMSVIHSDLIYGSMERGQLFTQEGMKGKLHQGLTVEILIKAAVALVEVLKATSLASASDGSDRANFVKRALNTGVMAKGADVIDLGDHIVPSFRIEIPELEVGGGYYLFSEGEQICIRFFDANGCYLDSGAERKVENLIKAGDGLNPDIEPGDLYYDLDERSNYLRRYSDLVIPKNSSSDSRAGRALLEKISPRDNSGIRVQISPSGENFRIWDEKNHELTRSEIEAVGVYLALKKSPAPVEVPLYATGSLEEIAMEFGGHIERIKPGLCHMDKSAVPWNDAFRFISLFCTLRDKPLFEILQKMPSRAQINRELNCPLENRSKTMLAFASEFGSKSLKEKGLYFQSKDSFMYLRPDERRPILHLTVEGSDMEAAEELVEKVKKMMHS